MNTAVQDAAQTIIKQLMPHVTKATKAKAFYNYGSIPVDLSLVHKVVERDVLECYDSFADFWEKNHKEILELVEDAAPRCWRFEIECADYVFDDMTIVVYLGYV